LAVFSDLISERVENLLQRIEQCQRIAGWARLWTIEYQDFRQSKRLAFRFALVHIKPSCGNTGDSASELRAIDKRFDRTRGGAINKATIALKIRESLTLESPVSHKAGLESLVNAGKPYR